MPASAGGSRCWRFLANGLTADSKPDTENDVTNEPDRPVPPVGRLAPSPTGELHLGHARTFLIAYWSVRARSGTLVLRLEDLDVERARPEYADAARRDLEWLGLDWDRERLQSHGLERIVHAAFRLADTGLAYPCVCSRGDVRRAASAPHGREPRYPGTCARRFQGLAEAERATGKSAGLRFRSPDLEVGFVDEVSGERRENLSRVSGDFLILRRDKHPAYHLAVVVDDAVDGVTEVVRGDDLLDSTPKHLALGQALGLSAPRYHHVPLVTDASGERLAKRAPRLALSELRARGVDPRRIVSWAARSAGIAVHGAARPDELSAQFAFSRLPRHAVAVRDEEFG